MKEECTRILIDNLEISMSIGIHAHEKTAPQRVVVAVEMFTGHDVPSSIDDAVCYETAVRRIEALAAGQHYELVERFAEDIAQMCLQDQKVWAVRVRAEKPDIMPGTTSVGVEIFRKKSF